MEEIMANRRPAEVFHPGEYLRDELELRGWSQTEFAEIINRPLRLVNEIIQGKRGISPETAKELGAALGTSAELWMNLNTAYHLWKSDPVSPNIERRALMRSRYPVRDMMLRNWLTPSEDTDVIEGQLLRFFEVSSIKETPALASAAMARRTDEGSVSLNPRQIAWLYRVKQIAESVQIKNFSKPSLKKSISLLKSIREMPEEIHSIPSILEETGVRFVIVEPLPSSKIDGVCFWIDNSPAIGLSLRYDRIDNFWFVLRHELEHVLNGDGKDSAIIDSEIMKGQGDESLPPEERAANAAAAEFCVPETELNDFMARKGPIFSRKQVLLFAKRLQVHPGLVVGQLQWRLQRFDLFRNMLVPIRGIITASAATDGYGSVMHI